MNRWFRLLLIFLILLTACLNRGEAQTPRVTATGGAPVQTLTPMPGSTPQIADGNDVADYDIRVTLDPGARSLVGSETLTYRNTTQTPIKDLVLHLYLNAFKSLDTVFMRESGGQLRGYEFNPENAGWIEVTNMRLQGGAPLKLALLEDGTLARAALPQQVKPGQQVTVEISFKAQLPQVFARTGWALDQKGDPFFLVGQWFPKPGVWTNDGWAADVFHGNAEFFADFGRYQVAITLPGNYAHGATGMPAGTVKHADGTQTVTYRAEKVIDFAWVASPNLKTASRRLGGLELLYLYLPEHAWSAPQVLGDAASAVERFSKWYGAYPYPRLTLVDVPEEGSGAGGMEYPTFVTVGVGSEPETGPGWTNFTEVVTVHEVAHQWWQSMVATNEGREPWLDEGFADYSTVRVFIDQYGLAFNGRDDESFPDGFLAGRRRSFRNRPGIPMEGTAWEIPWNEYVIAAYAKPDMALLTLERELGEETMLKIMRTYFERYRFTHPTTKDFQRVAVEVSGQPLDWFFDGLVYGNDLLNYAVKSVDGDTVTVQRLGAVILPVDVQATLENGRQETATCSGERVMCVLKFKGPVDSVLVDPQHKLFIDFDWTDNRYPRK